MPTKTRTRPAARKTPAAPPEPKLPDTQEGLLTEVIKLCDEFDRMMEPPRAEEVSMEHPRYGRASKWVDLRDRMRKLDAALNEINDNADVYVDDIVTNAISIEPGRIPPWSRAGTFLIWMGRTPIRCVWGGFPYPSALLTACDPRMPFPISGGVIRGSTLIGARDKTPADVCRSYLLEVSVRKTFQKNKQVPTFKLEQLDAEVRAEVTAFRDTNEWLRKEIAKGPVSPVPMPDHLQAIPMSLTF